MDAQPCRIQLSRKAGFHLATHSRRLNGLPVVNVARPGPFGNPFRVGEPVDVKQAKRWGWWPLGFPDYVASDAQAAMQRFAYVLAFDEAIHAHVRSSLGGRNLACWCEADSPCHADVLLRFANSPSLRSLSCDPC
jgi:hypothetical protein